MISVILVQHNRGDLTCGCVESLLRVRQTGYEIIVVDNASDDGTGELVRRRFDSVRYIGQSRNIGFGAANNAGAAAARGDLLFFLNNDTLASNDPLTPLEAYMQTHPECGAAGIALRNPDGSPQPSLGKWPSIWTEWLMKNRRRLYEPGEYTRVDWLTGAALCVREEAFRKAGGFDGGYFMYFEDVDLCRRLARLGSARHYVPSIEIVHLGGASQPAGIRPEMRKEYRRSQLRYYRRHATRLQLRLLRTYLRVKAASGALSGSSEARSEARGILQALKEA